MNDQQIEKSRLFKIIDNYLIDTNSLLGCGQYGNVYKGYEVNNYGRIFAIKETLLSRKNQNGETLQKRKDAAIREINSLKELNHPNVIRFINAKKTDKHLYLVMEYCEGGSLENYIEQNQPEEKECLYLFSQIVQAFKYLIKEKKRKHGDIKPANILLHNGVIKLADFGFSKQFGEETEQFYSYTGSPLYTSLQILEGNAYTTKSEIWSLGVTLYFMLCYNPTKRELSFPWWGGTDVHLVRNIKANPKLEFSTENEAKLSPQIKNLLHRMIQIDEDKRMNWDELFSCPIFSFDFTQEIIYDEYFDEDGDIEESEQDIDEQKDQVYDISNSNQIFTASFIGDHHMTTSQLKSSDGSIKVGSSQNIKHGSLNTPRQQLSSHLNKSQEDNLQSIMKSTKKITNIDVIHQQIYRGNTCLKNIQQGEQNSKLMQDLREYIEQERQLSFFVYYTAKTVKEIFEKLQLYFPSPYEAKLQETKILYVLCKRTKIIARELSYDIELKRSGQLLKGAGGSSLGNGSAQIQNQISNYLQAPKQNHFGMQNNQNSSNINLNGNSHNSKQQTQQQVQRSLKSPQLTMILNNNSYNQKNTPSINQNVIISKEHWNYFQKNLIMKQTYEEKLRSEVKVYDENYTSYKVKLQKMLNENGNLDAEDQQMMIFQDDDHKEYDDNNINLNYESRIVGQILQILFYELQMIISKIQYSSSNSSDTLALLNDEDLKQIYLIDDLFMIYTFESTFRNRTFQKRNDKINIQQFYFLRKHSNPFFLIQRLTQAYKSLFVPL